MLAPTRHIPRSEFAQEFPAGLEEIPQVPGELWMRGTMPPPGTRYLAVVGSRALTRYGREACEVLIRGLAGYPISIISGLALGADACAHRTALAAGLHTIAIPGSGLGDSVIGPRSNLGLAHEILKSGGALLSEHPPEHIAFPHDFPARNRLMVGLCDAVLMIEAGAQSGTLITARFTSEYNKDLLCVPHRIGDTNSEGTHQFLRLGATLVSEPLHILEALHLVPHGELGAEREVVLTGSEKLLYELLAQPQSRDELLRASGLGISEALSVLIALELKGHIQEEFGAWRRRR